MRVLVVGDFTAAPCGIRNFADQTYAALARHPGLEVAKWDGHYPGIYARREAGLPTYLPPDAADYDVIHVNWHPIAFNTYGPDHFPPAAWFSTGTYSRAWKKPILSVYLNDIPPHSGCPFHDRADVRFAAEESPGCIVLPYPVCDWIDDLPYGDDPIFRTFSVGCSTVRGDGVAQVEKVCARNGWQFRVPDRSQGWLSYEDEVRRIARNTVNVLWYFEGRGKSGGLSQAVSARRPVICSESQMFTHFEPYYFSLYRGTDLEALLMRVHQDALSDGLRYPLLAAMEMSWSNATTQMVAAWEEARR